MITEIIESEIIRTIIMKITKSESLTKIEIFTLEDISKFSIKVYQIVLK